MSSMQDIWLMVFVTVVASMGQKYTRMRTIKSFARSQLGQFGATAPIVTNKIKLVSEAYRIDKSNTPLLSISCETGGGIIANGITLYTLTVLKRLRDEEERRENEAISARGAPNPGDLWGGE